MTVLFTDDEIKFIQKAEATIQRLESEMASDKLTGELLADLILSQKKEMVGILI